MAGDTQPLASQQLPPDLLKYEDKVKFWLGAEIVAAFVGLAVLWTYKAPQLPGDTAGMIVGGFIAALSSIVQATWGVGGGKK